MVAEVKRKSHRRYAELPLGCRTIEAAMLRLIVASIDTQAWRGVQALSNLALLPAEG
ncbi:hypothetical protein [Cupriavidus plantarum]|uniref:hypothetical protein n=1 Tax=Cupriavidus plantarum TaxID=942865 RepID=UPI00339D5ACE